TGPGISAMICAKPGWPGLMAPMGREPFGWPRPGDGDHVAKGGGGWPGLGLDDRPSPPYVLSEMLFYDTEQYSEPVEAAPYGGGSPTVGADRSGKARHEEAHQLPRPPGDRRAGRPGRRAPLAGGGPREQGHHPVQRAERGQSRPGIGRRLRP